MICPDCSLDNEKSPHIHITIDGITRLMFMASSIDAVTVSNDHIVLNMEWRGQLVGAVLSKDASLELRKKLALGEIRIEHARANLANT